MAMVSSIALAQEVQRTPLKPGHPLIGVWKVDVAGTQCHEIYAIHQDGTTAVASGSQAAETDFQIDAEPSAKGFYKWVDRIVKDNGKPDCLGSVMQVGHQATSYIMVHPAGKEFLMCATESLSRCIGPFRRLGSDV